MRVARKLTLLQLCAQVCSGCDKNECEGCEGGFFPILVCRVALGKPLVTDHKMHGETIKGHDSVVAYDRMKQHDRQLAGLFFSEFVVSEITRIYPQASAAFAALTRAVLDQGQQGQSGSADGRTVDAQLLDRLVCVLLRDWTQ
jgi:hypothetical protein